MTKALFKKKFTSLVEKTKSIAITTHHSPDDDAIASSLTIFNWLISHFPQKQVQIIITGNPINRYQMFLNYDKIKFVTDLSNELTAIDMLIMVDGSQYERFSRQPEIISSHQSIKVCLDHHSSPVDKFDLSYIDKSATSASEIILELLYKKNEIIKEVAELFLLGILGDTGTFNYLKPNQLSTFDNVKLLLKKSQNQIQDFKSRYSQISQLTFLIIQEYIRNTTFVNLPENSYQYSYLTPEFIQQNNLSDGETSEAGHVYMAQYLRTIANYRWGFIATPKHNEISVSFRSLVSQQFSGR